MRLVFLLLVLLPVHTWTDSTGKHSMDAELIDFKGGVVYLLRDGQIKSVAIERLSTDGQKFVRAAFPVNEIDGEVVGIADGDTITVLDGSKTQYKIRLDGIDAPESHQDFGTQSRKALGKKLIRQTVRIEWTATDKYGRTLGNVFLTGRWINLEQVSEGWAWHYKKYNHSAVLANAESVSRAAKLGIWSQPTQIAPWDFRHPPTQARGPPPAGESTVVASLAAEATTQVADPDADETVYITETGTLYHHAGCKYLDESSIPILLSEAEGLYIPCKICHPELVKTRPKPEKKVAVERPRRSYNKPRQSVQVGPSISSPYALGGNGGGGGGGRGPVHVRGYTRSDGTYVAPYTRRAPSR